MRKFKIKLEIAKVIIEIKSQDPLLRIRKEENPFYRKPFNDFIYKGREKHSVSITIQHVNALPPFDNVMQLFNANNGWVLYKQNKKYVYKIFLDGCNAVQVIQSNKKFDKIEVFLLSKSSKRYIVDSLYSICNFLRVILIHYLAIRKQGICIHSSGVGVSEDVGLLFAGKSGSGKSTIAGIWNRHCKTRIINDDQIIIRKSKKKYFMYGSPWQGKNIRNRCFVSHKATHIAKMFFIQHASKNIIQQVIAREALTLLYPVLFSIYWHKTSVKNSVLFCHELIRVIPCYRLGFVNNKRVVNFIKNVL
ncbi:MAG: hypothetical protein KKH94_10835 [Candidatus Omnitrophica bacterium]|nr:hypothetical protein [Candidatus Omnitrophota bacterium]